MNDDTSKAMDEIMASIRKAVTTGETVLTPSMREPEPEVTAPAPPPVPAAEAAPAAVAAPPPETSLEGLVRSLLEPMLKTWLDANLPEIVETRVQAEIVRLTAR